MPLDRSTGVHYTDRKKNQVNPGDCNAIARQDAESRSKISSPEYCEHYDEINWKSKGKS